MANLTGAFAAAPGGILFNDQCPLSAVIQNIIAGQNQATEAINLITNLGQAANNLSKNMQDPNQWIAGTDGQGNQAYQCSNGTDVATISVIDVPSNLAANIPANATFSKYTVINQNIAGFSQQHGFVWWATEVGEGITEAVFTSYALIKFKNLVQLSNKLAQAGNLDALGPELNANLNEDLEEIPEVDAEFESDEAVSQLMVDFEATGVAFFEFIFIAILIYVLVDLFLIQNYQLRYMVINLSSVTYNFSAPYLDNVDSDHLPVPLQPNSNQNILTKFTKATGYNPNGGFTPSESFATLALLEFVNSNTVLEGLGVLLQFTNNAGQVANQPTNIVSLTEIHRLESNSQGVGFNVQNAGEDYYDNNQSQTLRLDQSGSGSRVVAQMNMLNGASDNVYDVVVIIMDA